MLGRGRPRSARPAPVLPRRPDHRWAALLPICDPLQAWFLSGIGSLPRSRHRELSGANRSPAQPGAEDDDAVLHVMLRRAAAAGPARGWPGKIECQKLADLFAGAGVRLRLAGVGAVHPERQVIAVACANLSDPPGAGRSQRSRWGCAERRTRSYSNLRPPACASRRRRSGPAPSGVGSQATWRVRWTLTRHVGGCPRRRAKLLRFP